ncbi:NIPA-like protein 2 [Tolypocladium ophioglossoides CBS 100239]|uniref:NIPA-like protein 2 n=1 Tax=Tolypocladium ophioglossoides (strain CBS 100239) TaxID=1163406 RepID=A0A0L0NBE2_TOLOC|nr:NIPA-like protein 2 [Tolypocladium ophioglossoides CBS 100239]
MMQATTTSATIGTSTATPTATGAPGSPGEALKNWSSLIGIVTAIVGNIFIALALNVQRYAHTLLHKERARIRQRARAALKRAQSSAQSGPYGAVGGDAINGQSNGHGSDAAINGANGAHGDLETDPLTASYQSSATTDVENGDDEQGQVATTYLKSPYWWLGQILITLGEMGNFLAYGFAPASIVSPLGVVALISNCIIAPVMFKEQFRVRDFWGVVIAVSGVVTVVLSAKTEETKLEPHDVWDAITTMAFEIYLGVTILLILILMWASSRYGRRTILIDLGLVGLFGGYTALATKGVSSMLSSTLWRAFATPVTYALILILLVTAVMQIRYVNKALQRFDSTQVIPIQFVLFTLCVILGSAILYRDFEKTTAKQAGKFVGGCLLTFFGVFLITSGRQQHNDEEDLLSDDEGVEETIGLTHHEGTTPSPVPAQGVPTPKSQSRRSSRLSRVSFADTVKQGSPLSEADFPSIRHSGAESTPDLLGGESSPLLDNPWRQSWDASSSPSRGTGTLSADSALAGLAVMSTPTTPMRDSPVPPAYPTDRPVTPRTNSGVSRTTSHHRSKTFISPSPLSSTVTTVVKDAFLREDDNPLANRSSMRRIRSNIRASLFFNNEDDDCEDGRGRAIVPASDDLLRSTLQEQEADESLEEDPGRRRSRSVSDALGDFFRPKKKRSSATSDIEGGVASDADASRPTQ